MVTVVHTPGTNFCILTKLKKHTLASQVSPIIIWNALYIVRSPMWSLRQGMSSTDKICTAVRSSFTWSAALIVGTIWLQGLYIVYEKLEEFLKSSVVLTILSFILVFSLSLAKWATKWIAE